MKIIIDANVIISAVFGGVPKKAFMAALKNHCYISPEIESEIFSLEEVLQQRLNTEQFRRFMVYLSALIRNTEKRKIKNYIKLCRDPKDDTYLSLAKEIQADIIITGDKDLLEIKQEDLIKAGLDKLKIITPAKYLSL